MRTFAPQSLTALATHEPNVHAEYAARVALQCIII